MPRLGTKDTRPKPQARLGTNKSPELPTKLQARLGTNKSPELPTKPKHPTIPQGALACKGKPPTRGKVEEKPSTSSKGFELANGKDQAGAKLQ